MLPAFGAMPVEGITSSDVEKWRASLTGLSNRSKNKLLVVLHGIFRRAQTVYGLGVNPLARVATYIAETSVYGVVVMMTSDEIWRDPMSPCLVKGRGLAFRTLPSAWYGGSSPGAGAFGVEHARLHLRLKGALWRGRSRSSRLSLVGERRHREAWSARWIGIE